MDIEAALGFRNDRNGFLPQLFRRAFSGGTDANRVQEFDGATLRSNGFTFEREQMEDGCDGLPAVSAGTARCGQPTRSSNRVILHTLAVAAAGVAASIVCADAFAGNAIADGLLKGVDIGVATGAGIATLSCIGAAGAKAMGAHGAIGPAACGVGGGVVIANSPELVGLVIPAGAGATLSMPYAMTAADWLHLVIGLVV